MKKSPKKFGYKIGKFFPIKKPFSLTEKEQKVVDWFHHLTYSRWNKGLQTQDLSWLGYKTEKCPLDLWIYQELITEIRPHLIIETGTRFGGSRLFLATICQIIGEGEVITVDIDDGVPDRPTHKLLHYISGSSVAPETIAQVESLAKKILPKNEKPRVMVILDSDHRKDHVLKEMYAYKDIVSSYSYMIVEDSNINGHPVVPNFGDGPMEAIEEFMSKNNEFKIDRTCERFMMTLNPKGYLKKNQL